MWPLLLSICASAPLVTETPATTALEYTRVTLEKARAVVESDRSRDERLTELDELLVHFLDTDTIGRTALGTHWRRFTPRQKKEFLSLFRVLFQRTYVQKLLLFERPEFAYRGQHRANDHTIVDTKIITPKNEFSVSYRLRPERGRWMAVDVQVEDLSLTANYRRQLDRILKTSSVENLLDRMRRRYGKGATKGGDGL